MSASTASRTSWRSSPGCGRHRSGGDGFTYDGHALLGRRQPRRCPKPTQAKPPVLIGGLGKKRTPALAARYADEFNLPFVDEATTRGAVRPGARRACEAIERDPATTGAVQRARALRRRGRGRARPPRGGDRSRGRRPAGERPGRHARSEVVDKIGATPTSAPSGSTSRCSTSATSTTSTSWRPRSCRTSSDSLSRHDCRADSVPALRSCAHRDGHGVPRRRLGRPRRHRAHRRPPGRHRQRRGRRQRDDRGESRPPRSRRTPRSSRAVKDAVGGRADDHRRRRHQRHRPLGRARPARPRRSASTRCCW